ncbi:hypothetical protein BaRGS_00016313 [Batillaria attramentaria]|uniref:Uncharacterized protein n=1 Tax=Batillaria attramentaria TaxID=370345 RepID=A0ABD0KZ24_9CAEN
MVVGGVAMICGRSVTRDSSLTPSLPRPVDGARVAATCCPTQHLCLPRPERLSGYGQRRLLREDLGVLIIHAFVMTNQALAGRKLV